MPPIPIADADDPRLADYRNLPDGELRRARGLFVAEGRLVVERLLADRRWDTRSVLVTGTALAALRESVDRRPDVPVYVAPASLVSGIAGVHIHRGALAIGARPAAHAWPDLVAGARLLLVLERIGNVDNVGGIFRAAAAFGVDAVLVDDATADPLYRKAVRTSMGAVLAVPFASAGPGPAAVPAVVRQLRADGWRTVGLTPAPDATALDAVARTAGNQPTAIIVGHEGDGLTAPALDACEHRARVPMPGQRTTGVDSLNAAVAAAIACYELTRAR